jgi:steroid delta-isomerase-like uncharacterized protein
VKIDGSRRNDRAIELVLSYYDAMNRHDPGAVLALLADDVVHELNQGPREVGKAAFAAFLERIEGCYRERLSDIVVLASPDGLRAAAEYMVEGEYVADDIGMPPARGQRYRMPGAAFFALHDGLIRRVSDHYNLQEWFSQVAQER